MNKLLFTMLTSFLMVLIVGCGSDKQSSHSSVMARSCPLKFSSASLCSEIKWVNGPTVDGESSFTVTFWSDKNGASEGPWAEPSAQVGAFIRMTCCGSVFFPKVTRVEDGKYLVSNVKFTPGNWEVYVQLKNGEAVEKQFITIKLED